MGINPGGQLDVEEIVGREQEIERYWSVLERQSLVLNAERRIGKTSILHKMGARGRDGFHSYYQELERVHSITELISQIYRTVSADLPRAKRFKASAIKGWLALSAARLEKLAVPSAGDAWKLLFEDAVKDVLDAFEEDIRVVFLWDEFPLMLYNLRRREGADRAIQLLDTLRYLRATYPRLRFLFTGSIGLHLALKSLRAEGNANSPFNDVQIELAPPLSVSDTAALIANQLGRPARAADVDAALEAVATSSSDPAHIGYTQHRIETYYAAEDARVALAILDALASDDGPLSLERLLNLVRHKNASADEQHVKSVCELLRQDQCITKSREGFAFTWPIVKRWWRDRRL